MKVKTKQEGTTVTSTPSIQACHVESLRLLEVSLKS